MNSFQTTRIQADFHTDSISVMINLCVCALCFRVLKGQTATDKTSCITEKRKDKSLLSVNEFVYF